MTKPITKKEKLQNLFLAGFILAVSMAQIAYIQSTYLNQFFSLETISIIFICTYIISFITMNEYPRLICRFNNLKTAIGLFVMQIIALLIFIYLPFKIFIPFAFIIYTLSVNLIFINFDIFLEAQTADTKTGRIRGAYYTLYNLGWVVTPFISGNILNRYGFNTVFYIVIFLLLPLILLILTTFKKYKNHYTKTHVKISATLKKVFKNKDVTKIFAVALLLQYFYATMTLFLPVYLNKTIGLSWSEIGIIFTIMLLPFVLLEFPAGYLADKYWGEKEMMSVGVIITSCSLILISFITFKSILFWAVVLFISRIGASLIEIMRDTYFFKKVEVQEIGVINAFRSTMPLGYLFLSISSAIILLFVPIGTMFTILGLVVLSGLYFSLTIKDTL